MTKKADKPEYKGDKKDKQSLPNEPRPGKHTPAMGKTPMMSMPKNHTPMMPGHMKAKGK